MLIRKANIKKIKIIKGSLSDFSAYYNDSKFMKNEFEKLVKQGKLISFFALSENKYIGKVYFVKKLNDFQVADGNHTGYICNLYVKRSYRNNGIGTSLIEAVKSYARSEGFSSLTLGVEESNSKNMRLYSKLGFNKKIKNLSYDLLFKDSQGNNIAVDEYAIFSCKL